MGSSPTRGSSFFLGKVTALGVLCCLALFVCLTLLASFFLPSHLSLTTCTYLWSHASRNMFCSTDSVALLVHAVPHIWLRRAYSGASLHTFTDTLCSRVSTWWNQNGGTTSMSPGSTSATHDPSLREERERELQRLTSQLVVLTMIIDIIDT